jgi:antitoxin (DNA-binding transcriptional repressor) of toxin-antitoxin stability system
MTGVARSPLRTWPPWRWASRKVKWWQYPFTNALLRGQKRAFFRHGSYLSATRRETTRIVRPVIHSGQRVILTERAEPRAEIIPLRKLDRATALRDLIAIGPVEFLPRK